MPLLRQLSIDQRESGHNLQVLRAVHLVSLRSLDIKMDCRFGQDLQRFTQLKELCVMYTQLEGVSALGQLTGLTRLELTAASQDSHQLFSTAEEAMLLSAAEQAELGTALAAQSNLQSLRIDHAPPGPVTQALSQLTGLTELILEQQDLVPDPAHLTLPRALSVNIYGILSPHHLICLDAPQLRHLDVCRLALKPSDLDAVRRLCRGVLQACSCLSLRLEYAWSKEDTVALMAVPSQDWQPSAVALQPLASPCPSRQEGFCSGCPRQWSVDLWQAHLSRQCLALLPQGLNFLRLL
jgi:hypothetical protein